MPRRRFRDPDPQVRNRNQLEILGAPGLTGLSRLGGQPAGSPSLVVRPPSSGLGTHVEHVTLYATASQTIAAAGGDVQWDRIAPAPTEVRGFDTLLDTLTASGSVVAIPCDITGRLMVGLELQFCDASTGTPLDTTGVDCTLALERVRDGVVTTMPDLLEDTDLIGITGWMAGWVRADDVLNVKLTTSADIKVNGQITVDIDGTGSPTSTARNWEQVLSGDAWGVAFDGASWWVTQGNDGLTVYEYDTDWTLVSSFTTDFSFSRVRGVTFDGTDLWLTGADTGGSYDWVKQYSVAGTKLSEFTVPGTALRGIVHDGTDLWISEASTDELRRYSTGGTLQASVSLPGDRNGLAYYGGRLYLVDTASASVDVREADGTLVDTIDVSAATSSPTGVFVASDGTLYVSEDGVGVWRRRAT